MEKKKKPATTRHLLPALLPTPATCYRITGGDCSDKQPVKSQITTWCMSASFVLSEESHTDVARPYHFHTHTQIKCWQHTNLAETFTWRERETERRSSGSRQRQAYTRGKDRLVRKFMYWTRKRAHSNSGSRSLWRNQEPWTWSRLSVPGASSGTITVHNVIHKY